MPRFPSPIRKQLMTTSFNTMGIIGAMDVEIALLREEMAKAAQ